MGFCFFFLFYSLHFRSFAPESLFPDVSLGSHFENLCTFKDCFFLTSRVNFLNCPRVSMFTSLEIHPRLHGNGREMFFFFSNTGSELGHIHDGVLFVFKRHNYQVIKILLHTLSWEAGFALLWLAATICSSGQGRRMLYFCVCVLTLTLSFCSAREKRYADEAWEDATGFSI